MPLRIEGVDDPQWTSRTLNPELAQYATRQHVANFVTPIEDAAVAKRKRTGIEPWVPGDPDPTTPNPARAREEVARATRPRRQTGGPPLALRGRSWFLSELRKAEERLKTGDPTLHFPAGCFPPSLHLRVGEPRAVWRSGEPLAVARGRPEVCPLGRCTGDFMNETSQIKRDLDRLGFLPPRGFDLERSSWAESGASLRP